MKKAFIQVPSLMLAILMSVSVFAGCKKEDTPTGGSDATANVSSDTSADNSDATTDTSDIASDNTSSTSSQATSSNKTNSVAKPDPNKVVSSGIHGGTAVDVEKINLGGKKVTMSFWSEDSIPTEGKTELSKKRWKRIQNAQKKYNFKFEWKVVEGDKYNTQFIATASSGKKFADIISHPTAWSYPTWFKNQYFEPLDAYVDYTHEKYKQMDTLTKYIDGKHYGLSTPDVGPRIVLYNKTILQKNGCKDPLVLAQEGKWNWDAFLEIAKKTTVKEGGKITQYGVGPNGFTAILESNGVYQVQQKNGKLVFGLDTPAALNALNFFYDMNVKHGVAQTDFPADLWKNFRDGKTAMQLGYLWEVTGNVVDKRCSVDYAIVPVPLGPDVKTRQVLQDNIAYTSFPKQKQTEFNVGDLVAIYLDAWGTGEKSEKDTYVDPYRDFYIRYEKIFKTDEELDYYWEVWQESEMHFAPNGGNANNQAGGMIWLNIMGPLTGGKDTPAVLVSKYRKQIQAALDELMK